MLSRCKGLAVLAALLVSLSACAAPSSSAPQTQTGPVSFSVPSEENKPEPAPHLTVTAGAESLEVAPGEDDADAVITVTSLEALPAFASSPDAKISITDGAGNAAFDGTAAEIQNFIPARNGDYRYTVTDGTGGETLVYRFTARCALPVEIELQNDFAALGEVIAIHAYYADGVELSATTDLNFQPTFYDNGDSRLALLPIHYATQPDVYNLSITAGEQQFNYLITVNDREFEVQHLTVDEDTTANTVGSDAANREWDEKIEPLKLISDPQQYWDGQFLQPVQGKITTEFGMIRYTNGSTVASRHSGIDIAAAAGTPVLAAGSGRVLFADFIQLTGNTVIIEHGFGVKSWYYHMQSLDVAEGDMVKQGDPIGKVGSTGFSTGPHLHFCMSVNNVFTNPWTAFEQGIG